MQRFERLGTEEAMPKISSQDVEKADRWQDRAGQTLLHADVAFDDIGVGCDSIPSESIDVFAVKAFVETHLHIRGVWVERGDRTQRPARRECVGRQTEENSECEYDRDGEDLDLSAARFLGRH